MDEQGSRGRRVETVVDDCEDESNSSRDEMVTGDVGAIWSLNGRENDEIGLLHYLYLYGYLLSYVWLFVFFERRFNDMYHNYKQLHSLNEE